MLVGLALFFGEQGSLGQTAFALTFVVFYIIVLLKMQPFKLPSDNHVALLVNTGFFFVMFSSLLLKYVAALCVAFAHCLLLATKLTLVFLLAIVTNTYRPQHANVLCIAGWKPRSSPRVDLLQGTHQTHLDIS